MLQRRPHIIALLQALLALLTLASCIRDNFADDTVTPDYSTDTPCYLTLQIHSTSDWSQTRATYEDKNSDDAGNGDFVHGSEAEHQVGSAGNFVIFFDESKQFLSTELLTLAGHQNNPGHDPAIDNDANYIEAKYSTKIYPDEEGKWPKWCLVVLNGSPIYDQLNNTASAGKSIDDILATIWDGSNDPTKIGRTEDGLFTMTNAVYVDGSEVYAAVEIKEPNITSEPDATDEEILHVHVERMAAKFSLTTNVTPASDGSIIFTPTIPKDGDEKGAVLLPFFSFDDDGNIKREEKNWRIRITGWGINALETKNYIFKNIKSEESYFANWNDSNHYRSYWSEDPHYDTDENDKPWQYPWQYRKAIDQTLKYYEDKDNKNLLKNYSYNDFCNETYPLKSSQPDEEEEQREDKFGRYVYVPENTYGKETINLDLDSRTNMLAGTHLIICAQLEVDLDGNGEYKPGDWYRDRSGNYYRSEKDCFVSFVTSFNSTLNSQETMNFDLYNWENGGDKPTPWAAKTANNDATYMLYYNGKALDSEYLKKINKLTPEDFIEQFGLMASATIQHGDGKVLPWLSDNKMEIKANNNTKLAIHTQKGIEKDPNHDGYKEVGGVLNREAGSWDNDIKSLLYEWAGAFDHFSNGRMYYPAAVLHNAASDPTRAKQTVLGDYGVARNSWYKFNLIDIKGIGIPVDNPEDEIVPDRIDANDVLNVTINILDWHKVTMDVPVF